MTTRQVKITAITGALAVALGAFGAHSLKTLIDAAQMETFRTASLYHFIHVLPMVIIALRRGEHHPALDQSFYLWLAGIVCFSGSLYILSIRFLLGLDQIPFLGPITPVGGVLFIAGWLNLLRYKPAQHSHHQH